MIDSVKNYHEPQINADKRRFIVPAISSYPILIDATQQNNHFFAPFACFAVKNCANHSKQAPQHPSNIFNDILKVGVNVT